MKTKVIVSGARGRLGSKIVECAEAAEDIELVARLARPGTESPKDRSDAESAIFETTAVIIETAPPKAACEHLSIAKEAGAPFLLATTGLSPDQNEAFRQASASIPVLLAPNLSPGIAVLKHLVEQASRALSDYDLEILELHHRNKRDAPSGTAWALARSAASARARDIDRDAILARAGDTGPRGDTEVGMQSIRGGDVIGEHTVYLFGQTERLELTHKAQSRDVFAQGALRAARFLRDRKPGLYSMDDALDLTH